MWKPEFRESKQAWTSDLYIKIMILIQGRSSFLHVLLSERTTRAYGDLIIHFDLSQTQTEGAYKFSGLRVSSTSTLPTRLYITSSP